MAVWFEGTSTKNTYKAGDRFETSRGVVEANKDGSFTNVKTGQKSVGSSQSPSAKFYASGSDIAMFTGGGTSEKETQKALQKGSQAGTQVQASAAGGTSGSVPVARTAGGGPEGSTQVMSPTLATMWANRGSYVRSSAWSGKDDPAQDNLLGGRHWQASAFWTNAELFEARYGEVGETLIGLAVLGADIGWNARRMVFGENHANKNVGELTQKAIANQFTPENTEKHLDMFGGWVNDIRGWAADNKAREMREAALQAEFDEAWDARLSYGKAEWDKIHTPMNGPMYEDRLTPNVWGY